MTEHMFLAAFEILTGYLPFPWQEALYTRFAAGDFRLSCNLPTGLGKTSVIPIWLIALANHPRTVPRRLVYVVNRRTVVDQATDEAVEIRKRLPTAPALAEGLRNLCSERVDNPLAISTLRGQFADNREWSADPSRPAIIVGTVDMIGSRLLFGGYGLGFKTKPLHAGFLGQDALLVHDEAHLEPAFQRLIEAIRDEQENEPAPLGEGKRLRVMALTATPRGTNKPFGLTDEERTPPEVFPDEPTRPVHFVWQRLEARKRVAFHMTEGEKERIADRIGKLAKKHANSGAAILVYVNTLEDHAIVCRALDGEDVQVLTGTLRGVERDRMADPRKETGCPIFARFLKPPRAGTSEVERWKVEPAPGTVYLVCTSAGEVGIDISADHLVCDLVAFERMAQRFGRVNRYGAGDASIDVVHEAAPDKKKENDPNEQARWMTLELLKELPQVGERRSASPLALMNLRARVELGPKFDVAFSPEPKFLLTSDILFDAWALTTIRNKLPGRPPLEPYLHGKSDRELPETHVAWRDEVWELRDLDLTDEQRADLLGDYPLKPHELLRDRSDRVFKHLASLSKDQPERPVWLLDQDGTVEVFTLAELTDKKREDRIHFRTVLLPPAVGGLKRGLLTGNPEDAADDVADEWLLGAGKPRRARVWDNDPVPPGMRLVRPMIDIDPNAEEDERDEGEVTRKRFWKWCVRPRSADDDGSKTSRDAVWWDDHTNDVRENAERIVQRLRLPDDVGNAVIIAAEFHDRGKKRVLWQRSIGNPNPPPWLAKSGKTQTGEEIKPVDLRSNYRHEFGSLLDLDPDLGVEPKLQGLNDDQKDLVLHLIAAHHGRGRPHFDADEAFDPERSQLEADRVAAEVPRRFARLQRKYGRWGLAYLESLLRAADYAASANPSATLEDPA